MKTFTIIGAGQRGKIYAHYLAQENKIAAVVEPNDERRAAFCEKYDITPDMAFTSPDDFFARGKICDAVVIASMDRDHFAAVMSAIDLQYGILLEKPISPSLSECQQITEKAKQNGTVISVCHVLRYTPFYQKIKEILDAGTLGPVVSIQHNENVGNYHIAHSFVRGNWRRAEDSSPLILQKSCHDLDILVWLVGSAAQSVTSLGDLRYFRPDHAPSGAGQRCLDCAAAKDCRFDARKVYLPILGQWPATAVSLEQTEEVLTRALETGPYGRCVYACDNTVCDNQATLIGFKNGVTVTFQISGFTDKIARTLKIMCENGEIRGDDAKNEIEIVEFSSNYKEQAKRTIINPEMAGDEHAGHDGDSVLVAQFLEALSGGRNISSIEQSMESHLMAFAAEKSRQQGVLVNIDDLRGADGTCRC